MATKTLRDDEIQDMVDRYITGMNTMEELAEIFDMSRRTISRILAEQGVYSTTKEARLKDAALLNIIKKYNVDSPEDLEKIFLTPALVLPNVLAFLKECTPSELAYLFYEAALSKVQEKISSKKNNKKEVEDVPKA